MNYEKVIKRADGSRIKITVRFTVNCYGPDYYASVFKCEPGKRKFLSVVDGDSYEYRQLDLKQRAAYRRRQQLNHVTPEELQQVKLDLWESLKPA